MKLHPISPFCGKTEQIWKLQSLICSFFFNLPTILGKSKGRRVVVAVLVVVVPGLKKGGARKRAARRDRKAVRVN